MDLDPEIAAYYAKDEEHDRLTRAPSLELLRTRVLLERRLPAPPARVLDVGGGAGVHASWLAERGYQVHLVDPVPLHVERAAAHGGFSAAVGDARALDASDGEYDAVLLLGPLYHLPERADRVRALTEAARAVRSGGVVAAAAISRYASALDGFFRGLVDGAGFAEIMAEDLRTGQHRNPARESLRFTTAFFHSVDDLATEIADAALQLEAMLPVEGPLQWAPGIERRLADPEQRRVVLATLAAMEHDPAAAATTAHLLAIATPRMGMTSSRTRHI